MAGRINRPGSLYGSTKAAVASIAANLRPQLTASGIKVALVEPGITDTPFWGEAGAPAFALAAGAVAEAVGWIVAQPAGCRRQRGPGAAGRPADLSPAAGHRSPPEGPR